MGLISEHIVTTVLNSKKKTPANVYRYIEQYSGYCIFFEKMFISRNQQLAKICKIVLVNKFTTYTLYIAFNVQFNIQGFFLINFSFKKWRFSYYFLQSSFYGDSSSLKTSTTSRTFKKKRRRIINELTGGGVLHKL